jgi:S1-C subfamily serine protease
MAGITQGGISMRRLRALLVAGLVAAPMSAAASPPPERQPDEPTSETYESPAGKPRLGIAVMGLTPELRIHFGAPDHSGVLVAHVEPGSAAAKAGMLVGDVIVDVRGHSVDDAGDIRAALASVAKGQTASIKLVRDGTARTVEVTLTSDAPTRTNDAS